MSKRGWIDALFPAFVGVSTLIGVLSFFSLICVLMIG